MAKELSKNSDLEFSRVLDFASLEPGRTYTFDFTADEEELEKLAGRYKIPGVTKLTAHMKVDYPGKDARIKVSGQVDAHITQNCIVSLEEVEQDVSAPFDLDCMDESHISEEFDEEDFEDFVEPISNNRLDLGELATQYLALEIDPYPRKEGIEPVFDDAVDVTPEENTDTQRNRRKDIIT